MDINNFIMPPYYKDCLDRMLVDVCDVCVREKYIYWAIKGTLLEIFRNTPWLDHHHLGMVYDDFKRLCSKEVLDTIREKGYNIDFFDKKEILRISIQTPWLLNDEKSVILGCYIDIYPFVVDTESKTVVLANEHLCKEKGNENLKHSFKDFYPLKYSNSRGNFKLKLPYPANSYNILDELYPNWETHFQIYIRGIEEQTREYREQKTRLLPISDYIEVFNNSLQAYIHASE